MSDFFSEKDISNMTITKENDVVKSFSTLNPDIKLGNLPRYEDIHKTNMNNINPQDIRALQNDKETEYSSIQFRKQVDKASEVKKIRVTIFTSVYLLVTLILTGFVIYNLINAIVLKNEASRNQTEISYLNKAIKKAIDQNNSDNISYSVEIPDDLNINNI